MTDQPPEPEPQPQPEQPEPEVEPDHGDVPDETPGPY